MKEIGTSRQVISLTRSWKPKDKPDVETTCSALKLNTVESIELPGGKIFRKMVSRAIAAAVMREGIAGLVIPSIDRMLHGSTSLKEVDDLSAKLGRLTTDKLLFTKGLELDLATCEGRNTFLGLALSAEAGRL